MMSTQVLDAFDRYLVARGLALDAVVVGGTALNLLGVTTRVTRDCDILYPDLPEAIVLAARAFASEWRSGGRQLRDDWRSNGPASLTSQLPAGWQDQVTVAFHGAALVLRTPGRADLLRSKLFALCDRGIDLADCIALAPTAEELRDLLPWVQYQDANPDWPEHVSDAGRPGRKARPCPIAARESPLSCQPTTSSRAAWRASVSASRPSRSATPTSRPPSLPHRSPAWTRTTCASSLC